MMTNLMTILERKAFISSNPRIVLSSCPPPCGHFSIQESATGGLSYKVKKELLEILKVVNAPKSGLDISKNGFDYIYLKSHMRYFNELDLSPITISQKSFKRCGENFFPNPRKYISGETAELLRTSDI